MALQLLAANNAQSVLAAGISASATALTLNTGTGALFPSPVSGTSFFKLTLIDAATGQISEIVHVTAKSGDVLTIVRGQEGTAARSWSANDIAANMLTAGTILLLAQLESPAFTGTPTAPTAPAGTNTTQIANTAFIQAAITALSLGTASQKNVGTGTGQIPDMSSFVFNLGGSGAAYNWLPGGNLIQMGRATTSTTGQQFVNIPITYPNGNFNVVAIAMDQAVPNIISAAGTTASQIAINAWGANSSGNLGQRVSTPIFWLTFGN
ncbi:gp53-like domain-containing protein [Enterobacter roggenkampii]|uniref:gp53-like domain-containing protein n=2 Tax=Enterobacter roggenkampii TaxID=1812935 RepID=UPI0020750A4A|nr:hypothetical protein [Enterobacter roggenkampii]MCM7722272.1 hypothetical protein [Enterobacter roggenkampii]